MRKSVKLNFIDVNKIIKYEAHNRIEIMKDRIEERKLFKRNKKSIEVKILEGFYNTWMRFSTISFGL